MLGQNLLGPHASAEGHTKLSAPPWLKTVLPKNKPHIMLIRCMLCTHQKQTSWPVQGSQALAAQKAAALAAQRAAALTAAQPVSSAARPVPASAPRVSTCTFMPLVCSCLTGLHLKMSCSCSHYCCMGRFSSSSTISENAYNMQSYKMQFVTCRSAVSDADTSAFLSNADIRLHLSDADTSALLQLPHL